MKNFLVSLIISILVATGIVYLTEAGILPWEKITGKYYSVPDMSGLSREGAQVLARVKKLNLTVAQEVYSDEYKKGTVISQAPPATAKTGDNSVSIVVSRGRPVVYMPDIIGLDIESAVKQLKKESLKNIKKVFKHSEKPENKVISTRPEAGQDINYEEQIEVTGSKGPKLTTVPDLAGRSLSYAKNILSEKNLQLGYIKKETDIEQRFGVILRQHPLAGRKVKEKTSVTIVLNEEEK